LSMQTSIGVKRNVLYSILRSENIAAVVDIILYWYFLAYKSYCRSMYLKIKNIPVVCTKEERNSNEFIN
jgi:hypothetical protein